MTTATEITTPRHPVVELLARYRAIFGAVWAARHELAGPKRLADEAAFLPAALRLQETPAHSAPRRVALAVCTLFIIALIWSIVGEIDIVAVAPGRIVVSERTTTLQPLETSVVKPSARRTRRHQRCGRRRERARAIEHVHLRGAPHSALIKALRTGTTRALAFPPLPLGEGWGEGAGPPQRAQLTTQLQAEWSDITAKLAKLDADQARRQAELATVRELIKKLEATLPIATQREADFKGLAEQGFMSSHAGQDRTRERIEQERDPATQKAKLAEAQAALRESENTRSAYLAETQRALSDRQAQAASKRQQFTQERSKTEQ